MGKRKYSVSDKCKTEGCEYTARVKGYCVNCYIKARLKNKRRKDSELLILEEEK